MSNLDILPICKICNDKAILADAGLLSSKPYYYCRNCKIELDFWGYELFYYKQNDDEKHRITKELDDYLREHPEMQGYLISDIEASMKKDKEIRPIGKKIYKLSDSKKADASVDSDLDDDFETFEEDDFSWAYPHPY